MPLLEVRRLDAGYRDLQVLHGVGMEVDAGTLTAVVGGPGAGKSTLLLCIAGALRPLAGRIVHRGEDVTGASVEDMRRRGCVPVPAGRRVFPASTVDEALGLAAADSRDPAAAVELRARCHAAFPDLRGQRSREAGTLDETRRQMLSIAQGVMSAPDVLLVDEPLLGLGREDARTILGGLAVLAAGGTACLLCTRRLRTPRGAASGVPDSTLELRGGRLAPLGPPGRMRR